MLDRLSKFTMSGYALSVGKKLSLLFQKEIDIWCSWVKSIPKKSSAKFEIKNSMLISPTQSAKIDSCAERQSKKIISALLFAELNIF